MPIEGVPPTDIHTIVFEGDVRLLELQLLSVAKFIPRQEVACYRITLNAATQEANRALQRHLSAIVHGLPLEFHHAPPNANERGGWRGQQLLKLLSAASSTAEHVLMLDAKNHFVRPTSLARFFDGTRAKTTSSKPPPLFTEKVSHSLSAFGLTYDGGNTMPTITPYVMVPSVVRTMIAELEGSTGKPLSEAFDTDPHLRQATEFFLYYGYLLKHGLVEQLYVTRPKVHETLFASWPQDHAIVEKLIRRVMEDETAVMFGLHRLRLAQLTETEKRMIAELWEPLAPPEGPAYYLSPALPPPAID